MYHSALRRPQTAVGNAANGFSPQLGHMVAMNLDLCRVLGGRGGLRREAGINYYWC